MIKRVSREQIERLSRRSGVRVEKTKPAAKVSEQPQRKPAPPKPEQDLRPLLEALHKLMQVHNVTLAQLAELIVSKKAADPTRYIFEGIAELRITERDRDGNILAIRPVHETRH